MYILKRKLKIGGKIVSENLSLKNVCHCGATYMDDMTDDPPPPPFSFGYSKCNISCLQILIAILYCFKFLVDVLQISAKKGIGVEKVLEDVIEKIPP